MKTRLLNNEKKRAVRHKSHFWRNEMHSNRYIQQYIQHYDRNTTIIKQRNVPLLQLYVPCYFILIR